jgi:hypothetical protein
LSCSGSRLLCCTARLTLARCCEAGSPLGQTLPLLHSQERHLVALACSIMLGLPRLSYVFALSCGLLLFASTSRLLGVAGQGAAGSGKCQSFQSLNAPTAVSRHTREHRSRHGHTGRAHVRWVGARRRVDGAVQQLPRCDVPVAAVAVGEPASRRVEAGPPNTRSVKHNRQQEKHALRCTGQECRRHLLLAHAIPATQPPPLRSHCSHRCSQHHAREHEPSTFCNMECLQHHSPYLCCM